MINEEANRQIEEILNNITSGVIDVYDIPKNIRAYITQINIPASITEIGEYVFSCCESLESVNIPASITEIGDFAFSRCESLESVNIPDSVTKIGYYAFSYCRSLKSIIMPDSVSKIGHQTFKECPKMTVVFSTNSPLFDKIISTTQFDKYKNYCEFIGLDPETQIIIKSKRYQ